ncbi:PREDICTED: protein hold'em [Drosophila arizonae]|uniref:Protein hold'em n=1 Tax=Drosophila arizonae TaxID=7263 RepID=A0ABM1PRZ6_DROAR|nr:PREDICTED: protein hold'em [Drosophila arizonae]
MSESGYRNKRTYHLADMQPTMTSFSTVALIIAKSEANVFLDKINNEQRGVISFTLRDSKRDIANCKCWGSRACVDEYVDMLQIGDVVDIVGAKVMAIAPPNKPGTSEQQRYHPRGTLPYALVVNEGQGHLVKHSVDDAAVVQPLLQLIHLSHKPLSAVLKLSDVRCAAPGAETRPAVYVDLLVAVATMRPVRELKRKVARLGSGLLQCLELVVIDTSYADGMVFTLWHKDWIRRARHWQPRKTILHLIDVRLSHSQFYGCPVLSHASCTLIYEQPQPQSAECQALLAFAASTPLKSFDMFAQIDVEQLPAAEHIQTQMSVRQIYARAEGELQDATSDQFTAVLYAMVSKFDIDGLATSINKKCKSCQRLIPNSRNDCDNESCLLEFSLCYSGPRFEYFFNINVHLSDQTGTLVETRLSGGVAEHLLGLKADAFQLLSERRKTELKWRFLLKYFEVKLLIRKPTAMRKDLAVIIVDMELIQLDRLIEKITVF